MYEQIKKMIDRLFADKSQSQQDTLSDLQDIRDHIDILIEMIENDLAEG